MMKCQNFVLLKHHKANGRWKSPSATVSDVLSGMKECTTNMSLAAAWYRERIGGCEDGPAFPNFTAA